jgi:hypothetical protein
MARIVKTPDANGRGHCYDGTGWNECDFWSSEIKEGGVIISRCKLFGNTQKDKSKSLVCCDKIYSNYYIGEV